MVAIETDLHIPTRNEDIYNDKAMYDLQQLETPIPYSLV